MNVNVDEEEGMCQDRSKWESIHQLSLPNLLGNRRDFMFVRS